MQFRLSVTFYLEVLMFHLLLELYIPIFIFLDFLDVLSKFFLLLSFTEILIADCISQKIDFIIAFSLHWAGPGFIESEKFQLIKALIHFEAAVHFYCTVV